MLETDILQLDSQIRKKLEEKVNNILKLKSQLDEIKETLENPIKPRFKRILENEAEELEKTIAELETNSELNYYILVSTSIVEEYKNILKIPTRLSFMGKENGHSKDKVRIINKFMEISYPYLDFDLKSKVECDSGIKCLTCGNSKNFDIIERETYVCPKCFTERTIFRQNSLFNDNNRVNISSKYVYERKIHFRDCIKQYQAKQNCTIPQKVFDDLLHQFEVHYLLKGDTNDPIEYRCQNITKKQILLFLRELEYTNHYKNLHLIHYTLTKIKPNDISHLEDKLLDDFEVLTDLYDKEFTEIDRKHFMNTLYVLYQLLHRHKYKCEKEDFVVLKTLDRKFFHDSVGKLLFEKLGWNHSPYY